MSNAARRKATIDDVKTYWNARPCNVRHSRKAVGTKEYFEEVSKKKYFVEPHILTFADFKKWSGKKVLEIGCGIGSDTCKFVESGAELVSVDLSDKSMELAKQRIHLFGYSDRVKFYNGNAEKLSTFVPAQKFDLIYSFGVIHHSENPENILQEMKKFCTPATTVKVMVYNRISWKVLWIGMTYGKFQFGKIRELIATYSEAQEGCPITYSYSPSEIKKVFERNGYEVDKVEVDHIFPYSIPEYREGQYKKVWYFRFMPRFLFQALSRMFGWHLLVTAHLK